MPANDPECNPPPDGYEEQLESYLFKPLREKWSTILKESKNSVSLNPWFQHVSQWLIHPQELVTDNEFPTIFVLTPDGTFEKHGIMGKGMVQYRALITLQFEYYSKHYQRNVTNESEHFLERVAYLIMKNQNLPFNTVDGKVLCQTQIVPGNFSFNFFGRNKHIIRWCVLNAIATVPLIVKEPP